MNAFGQALTRMRLWRVAVLLALALLAGLATDWLRTERVVFPPKVATTAGP